MMALLKGQQINKSDRNDARGIAQMMRVGLFKPVHVKTQLAQEQRMLLRSRRLLQRKLLDLECDLRGTLRNFSRAVGAHVGLTPRRHQSGEIDYGAVSKIWRHHAAYNALRGWAVAADPFSPTRTRSQS
jgi:transposase